MKRAHRRLHFAIWALLAPILLWLLFLAALDRPPEPENEALPESLTGETR